MSRLNKLIKEKSFSRRRGSLAKDATPGKLASLIKERKWEAVRDLFYECDTSSSSSNKKTSKNLLKEIANTVNPPLVILAARYSAPVDIVGKIVLLYPEVMMLRDAKGKLPLHHAVSIKMSEKYETISPSLIQMLALCYPDGAVSVDEDGRTPLHLACVDGRHLSPEIVYALCGVAPSALGMEDDEGYTPLELALVSVCTPYDDDDSNNNITPAEKKKQESIKTSFKNAIDLMQDYTSQYWEMRRKDEFYRMTSMRRLSLPTDPVVENKPERTVPSRKLYRGQSMPEIGNSKLRGGKQRDRNGTPESEIHFDLAADSSSAFCAENSFKAPASRNGSKLERQLSKTMKRLSNEKELALKPRTGLVVGLVEDDSVMNGLNKNGSKKNSSNKRRPGFLKIWSSTDTNISGEFDDSSRTPATLAVSTDSDAASDIDSESEYGPKILSD